MTDAKIVEADVDGVFPEGFYATTNCETDVLVAGQWLRVEDIEMDVGVKVEATRVTGLPMHRVRKGDRIVVGHDGIRVLEAPREGAGDRFRFMASTVSSERLKARLINELRGR